MSFIKTALSESFEYYKNRVDHDIEYNRKGNSVSPCRMTESPYQTPGSAINFCGTTSTSAAIFSCLTGMMIPVSRSYSPSRMNEVRLYVRYAVHGKIP